jgi:hypothetical protein
MGRHSVAHRRVERLMAALPVETLALEAGALMVVEDTSASLRKLPIDWRRAVLLFVA